jgi:Flp pilus assembly protein TadD
VKRTLFPLLGLLSLTVAANPLGAEVKWIKVSTTHFTMFTSNGERRAKDALLHFEQVRTFFQKATKIVPKDDEVIQVVAFQSEKEYKPYRLNAGATAYYHRSQSQDFIVMGDIEEEHYTVAVHEYTHLVVEHSGLNPPAWLNEGLAELYSTLERRGEKTLVGTPIAGRYQTLQTKSWVDLRTLFAVDSRSPYYNEPDKMEIFYAESWLLTHMLALSDSYRPHFGEFLGAASSGLSSEDALRKVYGKDLKAINSDLHSYFGQTTVKGALYPINLTKSDETVQVSTADDLDLRLTLAQLLIGTERTEQAATSLAELSKEYKESPKVEEAMMDLSFRRSDLAAAQSHCLRAFELGSRNAQMLYNCAALSGNSGTDPKKIADILNRLLEVQPANRDGRMLLGFTLLRQDLFGQAIAAFSQVKSIPPERASQFYSAQGYALYRLRSEAKAKQAFELAKTWARTPQDAAQADRFLAMFQNSDQPRVAAASADARNNTVLSNPAPAERLSGQSEEIEEAPVLKRVPGGVSIIDGGTVKTLTADSGLKKVEGLLTRIDCAGKTVTVHITVAGRDQTFTITGPDDVLIRNSDDNETFTFSCGAPLNRGATLYFLVKPDMGKMDGIAKRIEFTKK